VTLTPIIAHQAACEAGILHRDLSPGNIMILDNNEQNISGGMLIDWDLSKALDPPDKPNAAHCVTLLRALRPDVGGLGDFES